MTQGLTVNGLTWPAPGPALGATATGETVTAATWQHDDGHMEWDDAGWVSMFVLMAVFWIGLLALGAWAVSTYARKGNGARPETPLDIARRRYASGEISREEFEAIRQNLEK